MRRAFLGSIVALSLTSAACTDVTGAPRDAAGAVDAPADESTVAPPSTGATDPTPTTAAATPTSTTTTTTTEPAPQTWTLLAGGDVLMDRSEPADIEVFAGIEPQLATADLALVNIEMAISDRGQPADKQFVFRAPPSAAERVAAAGVDIVSLANNHAKDYGTDALLDTLTHLSSAGVAPVGAGPDREAAFAPVVTDVAGVDVAVVGISFVVPGGFSASSERAGIASGHDLDLAVASVQSAAAVADVTVAFVHWGIERDTCPSGAQRSQAEALGAAGADLIIGAHPHVLQPVEELEDGTLVAWSLGNFIWHRRDGQTGETAVLQIDFDGTAVTSWTAHPHVLDTNGAPVPAEPGRRTDRINDIIAGDCARHDLPTITTTSSTTTTEVDAEESAEEGDPADESSTTVAPTTTAEPTETSDTGPADTAPTDSTDTSDASAGDTGSSDTEPVQSIPPEPEPITTLPPVEEG